MSRDFHPVACAACCLAAPQEEVVEVVLNGRSEPVCGKCLMGDCPFCPCDLNDDSPLVTDNVPERRLCHADCVEQARREAEDAR